MDVPTLERTLKLEAQVPDYKRRSILIEAIHGVGKSEIIRQLAAYLSIFFKCPYQLIDIRLGQRETGDIIGMPRVFTNKVIKIPTFINGQFQYVEETVSEVMGHDLPLWFPRDPKARGILLFDELHNASKETLQAVQEVTLDHRLNGEPMPPGFMLIAAGNHIQEIYGTTTINPAQYDRFMVIRFNPTLQDWLNWAGRNHIHPSIVKFITIHGLDVLDPPTKMSDSDGEGATRYPSRRSWAGLSDRIVEYAALGDDPLKDTEYLFHVSMTMVGRIMAAQFQDYVKKDYKAIPPEDIVNKMTAEQEEWAKKILVPEMAWYSMQVVRYINNEKITKLSVAQGNNLAKFLFAIPKEGVAMFYDRFIKECREVCTAWIKENQKVKDYCNSVVDMKAALR